MPILCPDIGILVRASLHKQGSIPSIYYTSTAQPICGDSAVITIFRGSIAFEVLNMLIKKEDRDKKQ
ncbi:hypothetical protein ACJX0J_021932, partial [Zea mays]